MPAAESPTIEKTVSSNTERGMWGLDLDAWNVVLLVSLGVAAVAAFAVVVSTTAVIRLQKAVEIETKDEFDRYKLDADKKIAEANARANEASLSLAKLKAGRFLTPNGQKRVVEEMAPFKGMKVLVGTSPSSTEAVSFAATLTAYLKAAGLDAHLDQSPPGIFGQLIGIMVRGVVVRYVAGNDKGKRCAEALAKALTADDLMASSAPGLFETQPGVQNGDRNAPNWEQIMVAVGDRL